MLSTTHIDPDKPPRASQYLTRRVMCGACNFKCCNGKSLNVECTEEETKRLSLPVLFPQNGRCPELTDTGCKHGKARPAFCKLFPLQIKPASRRNTPPILVVASWSILNCPVTTDYELEIGEGGQYVYQRRKVSRIKKNNSKQTLELDRPIEEAFPDVLESCGEAIEIFYGPGAVDRLRQVLKPPKGFGL